MLLTLSARSLRTMLSPGARGKKPALELFDIPKFTRETLGLSGLTFTTDLLAGADRTRLDALRERADRVGCACLLLVESTPHPFASRDAGTVQASQQRMIRVVEAAQALGCSAAALFVQCPETDDTALMRAAQAIKPVVQRAEKLDISVLIAPAPGLTEAPDRVTELLKRVGGFRIGTFPDFEAAAASNDPAAYMHRLTPYAAAVCAAMYKLREPADTKPVRGRSAASPAALAPRKLEDEDRASAEAAAAPKKTAGKRGSTKGKDAEKQPVPVAPAGGIKKGSKAAEKPVAAKKGAKPAALAVEPDLATALNEEVDPAEMDELEALIEEAIAEEEASMPLVVLPHEPYALEPMIQAVAAVGYDGAITIDYRGSDDLVTSITRSRDTLFALLTLERDKRARGG